MPPEPLILAFDTSAAHCAAALLSGDRLLVSRQEDMEKGQAERLMPLLEELLAEAQAGWRDLSALGVGVGPGNFTGIRIAVAAARGLALSLGLPAIGVSRFEALAVGTRRPVLVSLDARRDHVWLCPLRTEGELLSQGIGEGAVLVDPNCLPEGLAESQLPVLGHRAVEIAHLTGGTALGPGMPVAEGVARLAAERRHRPSPPPAPLYLRPADAAPPADPPPLILP
ncbi:peptidase M22 [Haematobacter missouriensis]|uniref:tRNA (Adenosine(37)-N6)-threonylcarbamoyltransferase complex dimerization subunit type 1 TsaB n=1 Tax=Haematobacter missouriensis TaxID=366616 RepID=A0A212AVM7_9RHOB|nr:tRNA (adenosine(37)-N6)-threonylcarbamoyltransferase complex dimerization subunit type 1 TsaB [Haematobacter missouriensis]KFI33581.1 peptidase M22 [Haematobacter missouriensis]OWJ79247.1 tRNA (adenosine(37)-N6)-threonylcarbamoyltransferase complex dimerization subunit type 1 TsaB [Haematobacter missouriensis]OWJ85520.1 tRNA (adenosine(37)-N6)-threonylcarbamoyltransferase complex dimerization subunit type 1 TsaB [Haematobacter missouriensis]